MSTYKEQPVTFHHVTEYGNDTAYFENKWFEVLQGLLEDINPNEIVSHILDGTLLSWLNNWKMQAGMLVAFLLESIKLSEKD